MSDDNEIWTYRVLSAEGRPDVEPLETGHLLRFTATLEEAKRRFGPLWEQGLPRKTSGSGRLKPAAIEFIDATGAVRVIYTDVEYIRDKRAGRDDERA